MRWKKISDAVVRRLPLYLRVLDELTRNNVQLISSQELGIKAGIGPALVRKDLAWFGEFGKQGVGYEVEYLRTELRRILNLDHDHNVVLVGMGSLGVALARYNIRRYQEAQDYHICIVGLFDTDPAKVGQTYDGLAVQSLEHLQSKVKESLAQMAIITVPGSEAQSVAERLVDNGIKAILNFAPVKLNLPDDIQVASADLTLELQRLAYYLLKE